MEAELLPPAEWPELTSEPGVCWLALQPLVKHQNTWQLLQAQPISSEGFLQKLLGGMVLLTGAPATWVCGVRLPCVCGEDPALTEEGATNPG